MRWRRVRVAGSIEGRSWSNESWKETELCQVIEGGRSIGAGAPGIRQTIWERRR
jgi:hypothetical protein